MTTPHPGQDTLAVIYPDIPAVPPGVTDMLTWCEKNEPPIRTDRVTRDEFQRRMAGNPILDQLHESGPDTRVISLLETTALAQWLESRPVGLNCPTCSQPPRFVLTGGTQAFCGNDDCQTLMWDPTKTRAELAADTKTIDLDRGDDG